MAKDNMTTLLTVGAVGGAAYLAYNWWQSQPAQIAAAASPVVAGTPAAAVPAGTPAAAPAVSSVAASTPANPPTYSGPSLDTMYSELVAAVVLGLQNGDTAVTCPGGAGISGLGVLARSSPTARTIVTPETTASGSPTASAAAAVPARVTTCNTPYTTPDVWNWYLVNRTQAGVANAPDPSVAFPGANLSTPIPGSAYWAGVSPLISSSLGMSGLGAFGFAFRGMGRFRGFGDNGNSSVTLSIPGQVAAPVAAPDTTAADYAALVVASQGNVDTSAGSYSTDPTTGAVTFIPAPVPAPGISTPMLVLGGGALLLLIGVGSGIRK